MTDMAENSLDFAEVEPSSSRDCTMSREAKETRRTNIELPFLPFYIPIAVFLVLRKLQCKIDVEGLWHASPSVRGRGLEYWIAYFSGNLGQRERRTGDE